MILHELVLEMEAAKAAAEVKRSTAPEAAVTEFWLEKVRKLTVEQSGNGNSTNPDRMLTVAAAAVRCGMSSRWIYKQADRLPFVTRFPTGALRCSEAKLVKWLERRR